jgi:hypothetical protein
VNGGYFSKKRTKITAAFSAYLQKIRADGTLNRIVKKHYPEIFNFYPVYFTKNKQINKMQSNNAFD